MAFGPNSNNPRERRAYAHAKLVQLKHGEASYAETYAAIEAASQNRKGRTSGFKESLGNTAVVLVNWSMVSSPRPGIVHYNFGGFVMPREETTRWTEPGKRLRDIVDPETYSGFDLSKEQQLYAWHLARNERYEMGYETAKFSCITSENSSACDRVLPVLEDVINPAEVEGITAFIAWGDTAAIEAQIVQRR
jgi:hypothetical protein